MNRALFFLGLLLAAALQPAHAAVRLKELLDVQGVRSNELLGYGLVVGLAGTGDTPQSAVTSQTVTGMLGRLGVRVNPRDVRARNVAAVMVTARLPTYSRAGGLLDVSVSSMGDARSLAGGVLLATPLNGPDGQVYALAQGAVQVGGYEAFAAGSMVRKNTPTSGRVPAGATVEKAVVPKLPEGPLLLSLRRPDYTTASRIAAAIVASLGPDSARALDPAAIEVKLPDALKTDPVGAMAKLEELTVEPSNRARVVVNERSGTVVAGDTVRLRPAAVAHGGLRVSIGQTPLVSQPNAFSQRGSTIALPVAQVDTEEAARGAVALPATSSVDALVKALNTLGATPRDLISILQALKAADALDAELEVL